MGKVMIVIGGINGKIKMSSEILDLNLDELNRVYTFLKLEEENVFSLIKSKVNINHGKSN
jgi:hypothetical protein